MKIKPFTSMSLRICCNVLALRKAATFMAGFMILFIISCSKSDDSSPIPVADFTYTGALAAGTAVTFTSTSTNATGYTWDFGDASGDNKASTSHTYVSLGDYTVKLTATGAGGTNSISRVVHISCSSQVIEVGTSISVPTTWDACHIYHCASFPIVYAALTIEAGTIVKFDNLKGIGVGTGGTITANGTAALPVIFTSSKDDSYGGDTNGDGAATSPQKGDWEAIKFGTSSGNTLSYCKIFYAGSGTPDLERGLNMGDGASNALRNSVIAHTAGGINQKFGALDMSASKHSCSAIGNTFYDNGHPVMIGIASDFDNSNIFHNPDNISQTNICNGIFVACVFVSHDNATWSNREVAYALGGWSGNSWGMTTMKHLTLGDSVVVKFNTHTPTPGFSVLMPDGSVQLQNYNGPGVAFTAFSDDSRKGDTNGDGASSGTPGYWEGIFTNGPTWFNWSNIFFAAH